MYHHNRCHGHTKIAKTIINKDADYILALKENHKTLYGDTVLFFNEMEKMKLEGFHFDEYETVDGDHGRIETRKYVITPDIGWLQDKALLIPGISKFKNLMKVNLLL